MSWESALAATLRGQTGNGAVYENGTTAVTGNFSSILALEDSVFSVLTSANWSGDSTGSLPLPKGATIYGNFTAFTLTSGKVLAYKSAFVPS